MNYRLLICFAIISCASAIRNPFSSVKSQDGPVRRFNAPINPNNGVIPPNTQTGALKKLFGNSKPPRINLTPNIRTMELNTNPGPKARKSPADAKLNIRNFNAHGAAWEDKGERVTGLRTVSTDSVSDRS